MPEIENYPQDDTRCVIIYIAGYTCCNNEGIDDTFLYYEKYFQKPLIKRVEYLRWYGLLVDTLHYIAFHEVVNNKFIFSVSKCNALHFKISFFILCLH